MRWLLRKLFLYPVKGLVFALKHDFSVRAELLGGVLLLATLHYYFGPFTPAESLVLLFAVILVLITELQNSALEAALDRIHPEQHESIGASKDLTSAAVFCAYLFGIIATILVISGSL